MYSQHDSSGASAQILTILKPETATFSSILLEAFCQAFSRKSGNRIPASSPTNQILKHTGEHYVRHHLF